MLTNPLLHIAVCLGRCWSRYSCYQDALYVPASLHCIFQGCSAQQECTSEQMCAAVQFYMLRLLLGICEGGK